MAFGLALRPRIKFLLAPVLLLIPACGTTSPTVSIDDLALLEAKPKIYVIAAKQKTEILKVLSTTDLGLVGSLAGSDYQLRVTLGMDRGFKDCGTLNNVKYDLRHNQKTVVLIQGRGWTGNCRPNVFQEVTQKLHETISQHLKGEGA